MKKQPLLYILIAFILGVIVQDRVGLSSNYIWIFIVSALFFQVFFLLQKQWVYKCRGILLGMFFFSIGLFLHNVNQQKNSNVFQNTTTYDIYFELNEVYKSTDKYRKYRIRAISKTSTSSSYFLLYVPKSVPKLDYQHEYQSILKLYEITPPLNNYGFNYQKYMERREVRYQAFLYSELHQTLKSKLSLVDQWKKLRYDLLETIDKSGWSISTRLFMKSILLADKTEMNPEILNDFKRSGMIHVLAISGMHIAIIFGFFYFLFSKFTIQKKYGILLSLLLTWTFALFIGLGNSVFRACLMLTIYYVFYFLQRKQDFIHTWSLSMLIVLLLDSQQLFDIGFQLSFTAVLGIFWLYKPILNRFPKTNKRGVLYFYQLFTVSFSAQVAVLPLLLYYFHSVSLVGILSNIILAPIIQMVVILSFLILITLQIPNVPSFIFKLYDYSIELLLKSIHFFSNFEWSFLEQIPFHWLEASVLMVLVYHLRSFFKSFSIRSILRLGFTIVAFFLIHIGLNFFYQNKNEVVIHEVFSQRIISIKRGRNVKFYIRTDKNHKSIEDNIIRPYLLHIRGGYFQVVKVSKDCKSISFEECVFNF